MTQSPLGLHQSTPAELQQRLAAERLGSPFVVLRDGESAQRIVALDDATRRVSIGRDAACDIALPWDDLVSRLHAELESTGGHWLVVDDGLSSNGTFVAGERVSGRRRLRDGDVIRLGGTAMLFRDPATTDVQTTRMSGERDVAVQVTPAQKRVLIALCRPYKHDPSAAAPATNVEIAAELYLTVAAVKTHLRALFRAFDIDELPRQQKRRKLVALAFASGLVTDREL